MREDIDKLDNLVPSVAEQTVIDAQKMCDADHNKIFIMGALRRDLIGLLVPITNDYLRVRDPFRGAIIQVAAAS